MPRAYSLDLREKVMTFINQGGSKRQASKIFGIGEDTAYTPRKVKNGTYCY